VIFRLTIAHKPNARSHFFYERRLVSHTLEWLLTDGASGGAAPPKEFGKYRVLATIARGGMAHVHLAATRGDHGFTKVVVVKEMLEELSADPAFRTMFAQEARVAAQLSHPNIVTTFEADARSERLYMVMEYLDGQPLNRVRRKLAGVAFQAHHLFVLSNVLEALSYAHAVRDYDGTELRIVHRDVTPHNVFVTYAGEVKLVDFGIAKVVRNGPDTRVGQVKGKLAYMPPEQARGMNIDHRADLFSVGVMLWETFAERRLWAGIDEVEVLRMLLEGRLPDLESALEWVPAQLTQIILRALAPMAKDRYESADAMKRDLDAFRRTLPDLPDRADVGRLVAEAFSNERGQSNALIREQLARASATETGEFVAQSLTSHGSNPFVRRDASERLIPDDAPTLGTPPGSSVSAGPPRQSGALRRGLATFTIILSLGIAIMFGWMSFRGGAHKGTTTTASTPSSSAPPVAEVIDPPRATAATATTTATAAAVPPTTSSATTPVANAATATPTAWTAPTSAAPVWPGRRPQARPTTTASASHAGGGVDLGY
jgi:serine/threonine-protein kinase